ncbi:helix-turn-helix domain-containing protein [Pseudoxanthomonas koreensis]|uniref:helix-turn-helix domain-containing protein n=1 Tax=Pseudoxanthomonas koreensis TaxID=266061 RepID=UPI00139115FD|nr:helix-turn-helix domain-containing protein [Pseudoxanthomonas koreensis]
MTGLTLREAARALGISPRTLRRWLSAGAPVARRGRRGTGGAALIDPHAVLAWRDTCDADAALQAFAGRVPELVACAIAEAHRMIEGPHKRATAGALAGTWFIVSAALTDALRQQVPTIPEIGNVPREIERLRKCATE